MHINSIALKLEKFHQDVDPFLQKTQLPQESKKALSSAVKLLKELNQIEYSLKSWTEKNIMQQPQYGVKVDKLFRDIEQERQKIVKVYSPIVANPEQLKSPQSIGKIPLLKDIFPLIDPRNYTEKTDTPEFDKILKELHMSRIPAKAEVSYALIENHSRKLQGITEAIKSNEKIHGENPLESNKELDRKMEKLGYQKVPVLITKENGKKESLHLWEKDNTSYMVHTCPFWLIREKIEPRMTNEEGKKDPTYILNNNHKLCVSPIKSNEARLYEQESRAALIMAVPPKNILDTYARDRLSPIGFIRPKEEVARMTSTVKEKYEKDLERVYQFTNFIKRYRAVETYVDHVHTFLINSLLANGAHLTFDEKNNLSNILANLDISSKEALKDPQHPHLEAIPALSRRVDQMIELYKEYGGEQLDQKGLGKRLFKTDQAINILEQLKDIKKTVDQFFKDVDQWKDINLLPTAGDWVDEIKQGHVYAKRLMPSRLYGPSEINIFKSEEAYGELNIRTKGVDIVGFALHRLHLPKAEKGQSLVFDEKAIRQKAEALILPLKEKLGNLNTQLNKAPNEDEKKLLQNQIKQVKDELKKLVVLENQGEVLNLIRFSQENHIPLIAIG